ncbi:MAG: MGMT family protein [Flavobacteriales bacterium]|nr:MGMT family protein [Flavobacteriales bacterium]
MKKDNDFFDNVYSVVRLIPKGRASSYGAIAKYLGSARGARMVGWAMNNSHAQSENVPAHRVVNRVGLLSGKNTFPSPFQMQALLEEEGIMVKDDQIENFDSVFWDPNTELDIER